jgi:hypothetical protein
LRIPTGTDVGLLRRLSDPSTGRLARLSEPAHANEVSLWNDARRADAPDPLVINNNHHVPGLGTVGYVAVVNVSGATSRANIDGEWDEAPKDFVVTMVMLLDDPERTRGVKAGTVDVLVHEVITQQVSVIPVENDEPFHVMLAPMQAAYYQVIPVNYPVVPLGTPDLFNQAWVLDSVSMVDGTLTMELKFPATQQVYHVQQSPSIDSVRAWDEQGDIPFIDGEAEPVERGWTRDGRIDTIRSGSTSVHYAILG